MGLFSLFCLSCFSERPHCRGGRFLTGDNVMWNRPVWSIAVGCSSRVIEDWMIPFTAYIDCHSQRFSVGGITPKIAHSRRDLNNAWFLELIWIEPNGISIGSAGFAQHIRVTITHTHTDHATCGISGNRPHLCTACMPAIRPKIIYSLYITSYRFAGRLTSPFSTKIRYIGNKVLGGDLVLPG